MKRFAAIALVAFAAVPAHAAEDYSSLLMQMAACTDSEQCIVVEQPCDGWNAINKANAIAYNMLLNQMRSKIECPGQHTAKPATAECANNFCEIR